MPRVAKGGLKLVASGVSETLYNFVMDEVEERGVDISVVVIDALNFYRENNPTPEKVQMLVEKMLETRTDLVDASILRLMESDSKVFDKMADHVATIITQRQFSR